MTDTTTMIEDDLTCRDLIEFLADYVEHSLSAARRATFDAHLSICSDCRAYLDSYKKTILLSRQTGTIDPDCESMPAALIEAIKTARRSANS